MAYKSVPELSDVDVKRFWSHVQKMPSECWEWQGKPSHSGYGRFGIKQDVYVAHRIAYRIHTGIDPGDLCVRHFQCDNPPCVRYSHLKIGTKGDNSRDMVEHGRAATGAKHRSQLYPESILKGENHGSAMLTEAQVREIRQRRKNGESQKVLAKEFTVSRGTISDIDRRRSWRHI